MSLPQETHDTIQRLAIERGLNRSRAVDIIATEWFEFTKGDRAITRCEASQAEAKLKVIRELLEI